MMLRIEKVPHGPTTTIRLIGRIRAGLLGELKAQIQGSETPVVLDLEEVSLVDVDAVRFLGECQDEGVGYINDWIAKERGRKSEGPDESDD
jgi:hypothetical protein